MVAPGALGFKYHVTLVANWHNVQPVLFSVAVVMVVFLCLLSTANAFESLGAWEVSIFDSSLDRFSGSIFSGCKSRSMGRYTVECLFLDLATLSRLLFLLDS